MDLGGNYMDGGIDWLSNSAHIGGWPSSSQTTKRAPPSRNPRERDEAATIFSISSSALSNARSAVYQPSKYSDAESFVNRLALVPSWFML